MKATLIFLAWVLAACADKPPRPDGCDSEYAETLMHCAKPKPRSPSTPEECKMAGGVQLYEDETYKGCISHEEVRATLRQLTGQ